MFIKKEGKTSVADRGWTLSLTASHSGQGPRGASICSLSLSQAYRATNQAFSNKVILSGRATEIIQWFLLGVALQVFLAFVNKYCAYHQYLGAEEPEHKKTWGFGFWNWVNYYWQIDLVLDLASVIAFAKATIIVLSVYVSA